MSTNDSSTQARGVEKIRASLERITRDFDNMITRMQMDNARIRMLSDGLPALANRVQSRPDSTTVTAGLQRFIESQARQKAAGKELAAAAATFAQELIQWAEQMKKRQQGVSNGLQMAPSQIALSGKGNWTPGQEMPTPGLWDAIKGTVGIDNRTVPLTEAQRNLFRQKNAEAVAIIAKYGDASVPPYTPEFLLNGHLDEGTIRERYQGYSDEDIALMESTRMNGVRALVDLAHAGKLPRSQVTALQLRGIGVLADATLNLALVLAPYESIAELGSASLLETTEVTVGTGVREFAPQAEEQVGNIIVGDSPTSAVIGPTIGSSGYKTAKEFTDAVVAKYQALYNEGYARTQELVRLGVIPNNEIDIGAEVDVFARTGLRDWLLNTEGIKEGPGGIIAVNRRLYDPLGSGNYRVPDVHLPSQGLVLEGTISLKTGTSFQIRDYWTYSGGNIIVIRPTSVVTKGVRGSYSPLR